MTDFWKWEDDETYQEREDEKERRQHLDNLFQQAQQPQTEPFSVGQRAAELPSWAGPYLSAKDIEVGLQAVKTGVQALRGQRNLREDIEGKLDEKGEEPTLLNKMRAAEDVIKEQSGVWQEFRATTRWLDDNVAAPAAGAFKEKLTKQEDEGVGDYLYDIANVMVPTVDPTLGTSEMSSEERQQQVEAWNQVYDESGWLYKFAGGMTFHPMTWAAILGGALAGSGSAAVSTLGKTLVTVETLEDVASLLTATPAEFVTMGSLMYGLGPALRLGGRGLGRGASELVEQAQQAGIVRRQPGDPPRILGEYLLDRSNAYYRAKGQSPPDTVTFPKTGEEMPRQQWFQMLGDFLLRAEGEAVETELPRISNMTQLEPEELNKIANQVTQQLAEESERYARIHTEDPLAQKFVNGLREMWDHWMNPQRAPIGETGAVRPFRGMDPEALHYHLQETPIGDGTDVTVQFYDEPPRNVESLLSKLGYRRQQEAPGYTYHLRTQLESNVKQLKRLLGSYEGESLGLPFADYLPEEVEVNRVGRYWQVDTPDEGLRQHLLDNGALPTRGVQSVRMERNPYPLLIEYGGEDFGGEGSLLDTYGVATVEAAYEKLGIGAAEESVLRSSRQYSRSDLESSDEFAPARQDISTLADSRAQQIQIGDETAHHLAGLYEAEEVSENTFQLDYGDERLEVGIEEGQYYLRRVAPAWADEDWFSRRADTRMAFEAPSKQAIDRALAEGKDPYRYRLPQEHEGRLNAWKASERTEYRENVDALVREISYRSELRRGDRFYWDESGVRWEAGADEEGFYVRRANLDRTPETLPNTVRQEADLSDTESSVWLDNTTEEIEAAIDDLGLRGKVRRYGQTVQGPSAAVFRLHESLGETGFIGATSKPDFFGNKTTVLPPDDPTAGKRAYWRVVEAEDLRESHTFDGAPNEGYPSELQPRGRGRQALREQVQDIYNRFDSDAVLHSEYSDRGTPVIGRDLIVESGNGRTAVLKRLAREDPARFAEYVERMKEVAQEKGISGALIDEMENPVLVRQRIEGVPDRVAWVERSNLSSAQEVPLVERVRMVARRLPDEDITEINPGQASDNIIRILKGNAENRALVQQWLETLPETVRGRLVDAEGAISNEGYEIFGWALMARTFDTPVGRNMVGYFMESPDVAVRTQAAAILRRVADIARLKQLVETGQVGRQYDLSGDLPKAVMWLRRLRESEMSVPDALAQHRDLFGGSHSPMERKLLSHLDAMGRSPKKTAIYLSKYLEFAQSQAGDTRVGLFTPEDLEQKSPVELLDLSFEKMQELLGLRMTTAEQRLAEADERARRNIEAAIAKREQDLEVRSEEEVRGDDGRRVSGREGAEARPVEGGVETEADEPRGAAERVREEPAGEADDRGRARRANVRTVRERLANAVDLGGTQRTVVEALGEERLGRLYEHQRDTVFRSARALEEQGMFFNSSDAGTGKTVEMVTLGEYYRGQGRPVLIVAPSAVLGPDWEGGTFLGSYRDAQDIVGAQLTLDHYRAPEAGEMMVTTYHHNNLRQMSLQEGTVLFLDESQLIKNMGSSNRAVEMRRLMQQADKVYFSSATPWDKPEQMSYLKDLFMRATGLSETELLKRLGLEYGDEITDEGTGQRFTTWQADTSVPGEERARRAVELFDELTEKGYVIRREIAWDDVQVATRQVNLSEQEAQKMRAVHASSRRYSASRIIAARNTLESVKSSYVADAALDELNEGRSVIIFTQRKAYNEVRDKVSDAVLLANDSPIDIIRQRLIQNGIPENDIIVYTGDMSVTRRAEAQARFQRNEAKVFIGTMSSSGTGINLDDVDGTSPRSVLWTVPSWNASETIQAIGRAHRLNTKTPVRVVNVVTNTRTDAFLNSVLATKATNLFPAVGGEAGLALIPDELAFLLRRQMEFEEPAVFTRAGIRSQANDPTTARVRLVEQGEDQAIDVDMNRWRTLTGNEKRRLVRQKLTDKGLQIFHDRADEYVRSIDGVQRRIGEIEEAQAQRAVESRRVEEAEIPSEEPEAPVRGQAVREVMDETGATRSTAEAALGKGQVADDGVTRVSQEEVDAAKIDARIAAEKARRMQQARATGAPDWLTEEHEEQWYGHRSTYTQADLRAEEGAEHMDEVMGALRQRMRNWIETGQGEIEDDSAAYMLTAIGDRHADGSYTVVFDGIEFRVTPDGRIIQRGKLADVGPYQVEAEPERAPDTVTKYHEATERLQKRPKPEEPEQRPPEEPGPEGEPPEEPPSDSLEAAVGGAGRRPEIQHFETATPLEKLRGWYRSTFGHRNLTELFFDEYDFLRSVNPQAWAYVKRVPRAGEEAMNTIRREVLPAIEEARARGVEDAWNTYAIARRVQQIMANEGDEWVPPRRYRDPAAVIDVVREEVGDENFAYIQESFEEFAEATQAIIDRQLRDIYPEAQLAAMHEAYKYYIPLRRQTPRDIVSALFDRMRQAGDTEMDPHVLRELGEGGGDEPLDPVAARMAQIQAAFAVNYRNQARKEMIDSLLEENLPEGMGMPKRVEHPHEASNPLVFFRNGEREVYDVPAKLRQLSLALDPRDIGPVMKLSASFMNLWRPLVTTWNPGWVLANPTRDFQELLSKGMIDEQSWPLYREGMKDLFNFIWGGQTTARIDQAIRAGAVGQGAYYGQHFVDLPEGSKRAQDFFKLAAGESSAHKTLTFLPKMGQLTEMVPRYAIFHAELQRRMPELETRAKNEGWSSARYQKAVQDLEVQAAAIAQDATVDFSQFGTLTRHLNMFIPFLNARIQGTRNWVLWARENPGQAVLVLGVMSAGRMMLELWNRRFSSYKHVPQYEKERYHIIMIGGRDGQRDEEYVNKPAIPTPLPIKIPKSPIEQIFSAPLEAVFEEQINQQETQWQRNFASVLWEGAKRSWVNALPFERPSGVIPPGVSTMVQAANNRDWFRKRDIVPMSERDVAPAMRYGPETSDSMRAIGKLFGISPRKAEFVVDDMLGGAGRAGLTMFDSLIHITQKATGQYEGEERPDTPWNEEYGQVLGLSRFVGSKNTGTIIRQYAYLHEQEASARELIGSTRLGRKYQLGITAPTDHFTINGERYYKSPLERANMVQQNGKMLSLSLEQLGDDAWFNSLEEEQQKEVIALIQDRIQRNTNDAVRAYFVGERRPTLAPEDIPYLIRATKQYLEYQQIPTYGYNPLTPEQEEMARWAISKYNAYRKQLPSGASQAQVWYAVMLHAKDKPSDYKQMAYRYARTLQRLPSNERKRQYWRQHPELAIFYSDLSSEEVMGLQPNLTTK